MPVTVTIWTDLPEVGDHLTRAGAMAPGIIHERVVPVAEAARELGITAIRDATPKRSGALADSTMGEIEYQGDGARIDFSQPAKSDDGFAYVMAVVGGRGDVYPVEKRALASKDGSFGPVAHAGPAAANDYITPAMEALVDPVSEMLAAQGLEASRTIVEAMR